MKNPFFVFSATAFALGGTSFAAPLTASEFEATPAFVENFAAGTSTGKWEIDPQMAAQGINGASPPAFVTSTPAGVHATVTSVNPVGSSSDSGCMMVGNPSSTNGSLFGLDYIRCVNSLLNGTGEDYTAASFDKYRVIAKVFLFAAAQTPSLDRWQVGVYGFGGDLFKASAFYNTKSTGGGPGFGWRAASTGSGTIPGTSALANGRWTKISVMIDGKDPDPANRRLAICVDANGDNTLDESNPLEYIAHSLSTVRGPAPFGIFTVGEVNSDGFPLFVDSVEMYKPVVPNAVTDWALFE